jgi:hypothetical protein
LMKYLHTRYFPRVAWARLTLSPKKSYFFLPKLEVLGFEVSPAGVTLDQKKRDAMRDWEVPQSADDVDQLCYFLPFARNLVPGRADIAKVLQDSTPTRRYKVKNPATGKMMTKVIKGDFRWGPEQQEAFDRVRSTIGENHFRAPIPTHPLHLATDASQTGTRAYLFQLPTHPAVTLATEVPLEDQQVILFMSYRMTETETRYTATEREALAVIKCLADCEHYLRETRFAVKLYTDHSALIPILDQGTKGTPRIFGWKEKLSPYNWQIIHVPGIEMKIADGLSRMRGVTGTGMSPDSGALPHVSANVGEPTGSESTDDAEEDLTTWKAWWRVWSKSAWYGQMVRFLRNGTVPENDPQARRRLNVTSKRFMLVTDKSALTYLERDGQWALCNLPHDVKEAFRLAHDVHGHWAASQTVAQLLGRFYWPTRSTDVYRMARFCLICKSVGPRVASSIPMTVKQINPWDCISFDLLGPVSPLSAEGHRYVFVIGDYASRRVASEPMKTATGKACLKAFEKHIVDLTGWPLTTFSDNGRQFVEGVFPAALKARNVRMMHGSPYHPASTGFIESMVKLVKTEVVKWLLVNPGNLAHWNRAFPEVNHHLNSRVLRVKGISADQILFGWNLRRDECPGVENELRQLAHSLVSEGKLSYAAEPGRDVSPELRLALLDELRLGATEARARVCHPPQARHSKRLSVGDYVMARQVALDSQHGEKFRPRWLGPYEIVGFHNSRQSAKIRAVFPSMGTSVKRVHVDHLKLFIPRAEREVHPPDYTHMRGIVDKWAQDGKMWDKLKKEPRVLEVPEMMSSGPEGCDRWSKATGDEGMGDWVEFPDEIRDEHRAEYWASKAFHLPSELGKVGETLAA